MGWTGGEAKRKNQNVNFPFKTESSELETFLVCHIDANLTHTHAHTNQEGPSLNLRPHEQDRRRVCKQRAEAIKLRSRTSVSFPNAADSRLALLFDARRVCMFAAELVLIVFATICPCRVFVLVHTCTLSLCDLLLHYQIPHHLPPQWERSSAPSVREREAFSAPTTNIAKAPRNCVP